MIEILLLVIAVVWAVGTCVRVYRQARFFQIEEYMNLRYLHWVLAVRSRWLINRALIVWGIGAVFSFMFSEAPDGFLPAAIGLITAIIAVIPPDEGEIKKKFRATARAKRLLGASFAAAVVFIGIMSFLANNALSESAPEIRVIAQGMIGYAAFLLAPVWLVIGNLLMMPVEVAFRVRFIAKARAVLADVNPVVIGVTGSYGKTTTKTFLAHILNGRYKAYPTPKSYNTLMGVCIAINNDLANDHGVDYFICEMGAYIPGEIKRLCDLTHPQISMVVEVGAQHLERFGSLESIAAAKYEIIKELPPDGVGVFNWDNPQIRAMVERGYPQTRLTVSRTVDPTQVKNALPRFVASEIVESLNGLTFRVTDTLTGDTELFTAPLLGIHNVTNILLAAAAAVHERMTLREIARRVRELKPAESRLVAQSSPEGITIINDAYSANPTGIVSALAVLGMYQTGRRLLITPGMVELGDLMERENTRLGEIAAQHATDVILVGSKRTEPILNGLRDAQFPVDRIHVVETLSEAVGWYQRNLSAGDTVLFLNDLPDTYSV